MNKIINIIRKANKRYDNIDEPHRFFIAMSIGMPTVFMLASDNLAIIMVGGIYTLALVLCRLLGWSPK